MVDLNELLTIPNPAPVPKNRRGNWSFTQEFDPHDLNSSTITATSQDKLDGDDAIQKFIVSQGGVIPTGYRAVLIEARHQTHGWTRSTPDTDATTKPTWFYRFRIEPVGKLHNIDDLLAHVGKLKPPAKSTTVTDTVFHYVVGDTQIGKGDGDGAEGTLRAWEQSILTAVERWKKLGKPHVHLCLAGDCIEGNQSQNGKSMWRTKLTVTEQTRVLRRMMLRTIDAFIAAPSITFSVVNGNHDQVQRFQETRDDDGHATEAAIAVSEALATNKERYAHVEIYVPEMDRGAVVLDLMGTSVIVAHGHQWQRGKSLDWWRSQSFHNDNANQAHILIHGHEHEFSIRTEKDRLSICTPTMESESTWYVNKYGGRAMRGAIIFTTTPGGKFQGLEVV
jgi:predicted phosphodiesterase